MADHSQEGLNMGIAMHRKKLTRPDPARAKRSSMDSQLEPDSFVTRDSAFIEPDARRAMIAELAYYRAEQRGFDPGHEIKDWLEAEAIVDAQIKRGDAPTM
jgi:hypothetical protein